MRATVKFRIPEIIIGVLLTIAVFAIGAIFGLAGHVSLIPPFDQNWLTRDAAGFFTALLVLVGVAQIGVFVWQLRLIRDSARTAAEASHAAKETALATSEANRINRENLVSVRRAWLSIEDAKLVHRTAFSEEAFIFRVEITIKNVGQTPALSIWTDFESYFIENNTEKFPDAEARFKAKLRSSPAFMGQILFPNDTIVLRQAWEEDRSKIKDAVSLRPTGEKRFGFTIFIGVAYRIVGDETVHITYHPYSMLNVRIGTKVGPQTSINLPHEPFLPGEVT
jgi:hypothetical protein